ncbi:hypothetical protein L6452_30012 [Arctium lappa]|uniref:Uncharacterized protein n=1 Tax=Arctium lappa TaxID=4217 RepID=A0ACB8ZHT5_ARCLA|nr:hypothetical protein L6452_30012 [Arctium lappa]
MANHKRKMEAETNVEEKSKLGEKMNKWKKALVEIADLKGKDAKGRVRFFNSQPLSHCSHSTIADVKSSLLHHLPSIHGPTSTLLISNKQQMLLEDGIEKLEVPVQGVPSMREADKNQEPCEDMQFDSEEAARAFYDDYAGRVGFVTRVLSSRKSERDGTIISRGLGCRGDSENHKKESIMVQKKNKGREGCMAMILVKREKPGKWVVRKFVREHNHPLRVLISKRRPAFDEKDKRIQELTAELRVKKRLSAAYREQLLALMKDKT